MLTINATNGRLPLEDYISRGTEAGVQWTSIRRKVLQLLWGTAKPLGAYEAAERLSEPGRPVHPTSVYRCFHCLVGLGMVLPIVTWKKFLISPNPAVGLWAAFLCRGCRSCTLVELAGEPADLDGKLKMRRFVRRICSAECEGVCRGCSEQGRTA